MNFSDKQKELIHKYGCPFCRISKAVKINEGLIAKLFATTGQYAFFSPIEEFQKYDQETGLVTSIDKKRLQGMIHEFSFELAQDNGFTDIGFFLTDNKLKNIVNVFKSEVIQETFPVYDGLYIHLKNNVLVYNRDIQAFEPKPFSPEYASHNRIELNYNKEATCPRFINELLLPMLKFPECLETIQIYFGQCLLKKNLSQMFMILSGDSESGKSVTVSIFEKVLGLDNVAELHPNDLNDKFEMFSYCDKSLLTAKDVDYDALVRNKVEILKKMTGNDLLFAEKKHSNDRIKVRGQFNIIITGNGDLTINFGKNRASFERRLLWVPCRKPESFKAITHFDDVLFQEEGEGILAWAIEGALKLLKAGGKIRKSEIQNCLNRILMDESEAIETFVKACIFESKSDNAYVTSGEAVDAYYRFAYQRKWNNYVTERTLVTRGIAAAMRKLYPMCKHYENCRTKDGSNRRCNGYRYCELAEIIFHQEKR